MSCPFPTALRGRHLGPADDRHDGADVNALDKKQGRSGVPGIVETYVAHAGLREQRLPVGVVTGQGSGKVGVWGCDLRFVAAWRV